MSGFSRPRHPNQRDAGRQMGITQ